MSYVEYVGENTSKSAQSMPRLEGDEVVRGERKERIVAAAMAFPMEKVLKRYQKDQDLPWDVVLEHERELKRFLALMAINEDKIIGMQGATDELWHTFITFTRDYHDFSLLVAGYYIHHTPAAEGDDPNRGREHYQAFWDEYIAVFGEEPPAHLWPRPVAEALALVRAEDISMAACCSCVAH
jgi:hypothetical protein